MITKNFQKLGALVASLVGILTLSSAAEAITFTSSVGGTIGNPALSGTPSVRGRSLTSTILLTPTDGREIANFKSVTINGLQYGNKSKLWANLKYLSLDGNTSLTASLFNASGNSGILNGNYTFVSGDSDTGLNWSGTGSAAATLASGTYKAASNFNTFDTENTTFLSGTWTLEYGNSSVNNTVIGGTNSPTGLISSFSIDATPVPFESNAAPAGVAIVFGALMLRRKLQQRSAQNMSLESVNS